jgi:hypothetical protein
MAEKVVAQQWQWRCSNSNGGAATAMVVQQRLRRCSDGLGGAALALAAQRRLWRRSDSNGNGGAVMGVAVVVVAQRWGRSNGGGGAAMVVDRSHCRVSYDTINLYRTLFLSNKMISYVAFYVGPIQTGFLMTFWKSYGGTGIVIPVKKSATGAEKTGIQRIPAGIGNLARRLTKNGWCAQNFGPTTTKHKGTQTKQIGFKWIKFLQIVVERMKYIP